MCGAGAVSDAIIKGVVRIECATEKARIQGDSIGERYRKEKEKHFEKQGVPLRNRRKSKSRKSKSSGSESGRSEASESEPPFLSEEDPLDYLQEGL